MGLRLLLAARKSRKASEGDGIERQDSKANRWAEAQGHVVIHTTADIKSGVSAPWTRRQLKPWMTEPQKLAMYDGILISDTDRISRGTDEDWHWLENWCYRNGKRIVVADGPQFPPRDGAMGESDRYQWIAQKRAARSYWESVRDKHADTRELIRANGGAIGKPPFGYVITGPKLHRTFAIDPVAGPLVVECFVRISRGATIVSVARWLTEATGRTVRPKFITDLVQRSSYLGARDGFQYEPLISKELFDSANAALSARRITSTPGGRKTVHGYSGHLYCQCGGVLYRHKSERGQEKYRCSVGRRGDVTEARCEFGAPNFAEVNASVNRLMARMTMAEKVLTTSGGDAHRQMAIKAVQDQLGAATAKGNVEEIMRLAGELKTLQEQEAMPIEVTVSETGRSYAQAWSEGTLDERRSLLGRDEFRLVIKYDDGEWRTFLEPSTGREAFKMFRARDYKISMSEAV